MAKASTVSLLSNEHMQLHLPPPPSHTVPHLTHGHEGELESTLHSLSEHLIRKVGKTNIRSTRLVLDREQEDK